jgi:hypothetical protein
MTTCPNPLITHRFEQSGPYGNITIDTAPECVDPDCVVPPNDHENRMPCRWSWPYAHGRKFNGEPFPVRKCPSCAHIRRAGDPAAEFEGNLWTRETG